MALIYYICFGLFIYLLSIISCEVGAGNAVEIGKYYR